MIQAATVWFAGTGAEVQSAISRRTAEMVNPFTRTKTVGEIVTIDQHALAALPRVENAVLGPLGDPGLSSAILMALGCALDEGPFAEDGHAQLLLYRVPDASLPALAGRQADTGALAAEWTARLETGAIVPVDFAAQLTALAAAAVARGATIWATFEVS